MFFDSMKCREHCLYRHRPLGLVEYESSPGPVQPQRCLFFSTQYMYINTAWIIPNFLAPQVVVFWGDWGWWGTFGSISRAYLDHKSSDLLKEYLSYVYLFCFFNATSCCMLNSFVFLVLSYPFTCFLLFNFLYIVFCKV